MSSDGPDSPAERLGRVLVDLTRRPEARTGDPVGLLEQVPPIVSSRWRASTVCPASSTGH
jgi:hypothetical protein